MKRYTRQNGEVVAANAAGDFPKIYVNRTMAEQAAAKIPHASVIHRGRNFYVRLFADDIICPDGPTCPDPTCQSIRRAHGFLPEEN